METEMTTTPNLSSTVVNSMPLYLLYVYTFSNMERNYYKENWQIGEHQARNEN